MTQMKKIMFFLAVILNAALAQIKLSDPNAPPLLNNAFLPSPNSASLGKYGNLPVNLYSGTSTLSVPIWTINLQNLEMAIVLNYNTGGIRVEEMASWAGLGWSLNAGGVITRSVFGLPDETGYGFSNTPVVQENSVVSKSDLDLISLGLWDTEPDVYSFNFLGRTGKFRLAKNGQDGRPSFVTMEPLQNLVIEKLGDQFTVKDEFGNVYRFDVTETTTITSTIYPVNGPATTGGTSTYTSSWYLSSVTDVWGNSISIQYDTETLWYEMASQETKYVFYQPFIGSANVPQSAIPKDVSIASTYMVFAKYPHKINFPNGYLEFKSYSTRKDLPNCMTGAAQGRILNGIDVYNYTGSRIRSFDFNFGYLQGTIISPENSVQTASNDFRLMLLSVKEWDGNRQLAKSPYLFEYITDLPFPGRLSKARDHWGYNNGMFSNTSLVPSVIVTPVDEVASAYPAANNYLKWGNRSVDFNYAKQAALRKVTYPTGGYSLFDYESNLVKYDSNLPVDIREAWHLIDGCTPDLQDKPAGYYKDYNFEIKTEKQKAYVLFRIWPGVTNPGSPKDWPVVFTLMKANGEEILSTRYLETLPPTLNASSPQLRFLPSGQYTIRTEVKSQVNGGYCNPDLFYGVQVQIAEEYRNAKVGGLRVKIVSDFDSDGALIDRKAYQYEETDSIGKLGWFPVYDYFKFRTYVSLDVYGGQYASQALFKVFNSNSNAILGSQYNQSIGYSTVKEINRDGSTVVNKFIGQDLRPDGDGNVIESSRFPFPPAQSREWARGFLKEKVVYSSNPVKAVSKETNEPDNISPDVSRLNDQRIAGLKVGITSDVVTASGSTDRSYLYAFYYPGSGSTLTKSALEEVFPNDNSNRVHAEYKRYANSAKLLKPISYSFSSSTGAEYTVQNKYVDDLPSTIPIISNLKSLNMNTTLIETITSKPIADATEAIVIGGTFINYDLKPGPTSISNFEALAPILKSSFKTASASEENSLASDPSFKRHIYDITYDDKGNITSFKNEKGNPTSILWDYLSQLRTALIANVERDQLFTFTSFEAENKGGWNFGGTIVGTEGRTGRKSYDLGTGSISKQSLPADSYVLSYWTKGSVNVSVGGGVEQRSVSAMFNGWTLVEKRIRIDSATGSLTLSGTGLLDEVRLHPTEAQMTTYTHDPLIGVTSMTGPDNKTTFYEYDGLGRLKCVRDHNGDVVKTYDYKYKTNN
jgi:YD repeat-containing protein